MTLRPRLFFAFRSPFSWLTIERLRRRVPDALDRMELIPFWEPDSRTAAALGERGGALHYVPMSKAKHLYILQDTARLAARLDLPMAWPVDLEPWWEPSHLAWLKARRQGRATAFYDAVIDARWRQGHNISDPDVIRASAEAAGLDGHEIAAAVDDPDIRTEGVSCLLWAYEDDIFGVPYFRVGRHRFWGFDRLDDFLAVFGAEVHGASLAPADVHAVTPSRLERVPVEALTRVGAYDLDTPGGCG